MGMCEMAFYKREWIKASILNSETIFPQLCFCGGYQWLEARGGYLPFSLVMSLERSLCINIIAQEKRKSPIDIDI